MSVFFKAVRVGLLLGSAAAPLLPQTTRQVSLPVPDFPPPASTRFAPITQDFADRPVPGSRFSNSSRLGDLIRGGNLYLSLADSIALALENNLDIEMTRYTPRIADADLRRANGGGFLRGVPLTIREGPLGVGGPRLATVSGISLSSGVSPAFDQSFASQQIGQDTSLALTTQSLSSGPAVPILDPAIVALGNFNRITSPQTSTFITGTSQLVMNTQQGQAGIQKGFLTGGTLNVSFNNTRTSLNNRRTDINPANTGFLGITFTQPLLRGFGFGLNRRFIRIARNNRHIADLTFESQVVATVYAVTRLYWDLVSQNEDLKVRQETVGLNEQLLHNNQQQVEAGTLAPIEVVRARSELAASQRDLVVTQTLVRQQETVLKDFLTRTAVDDPLIANVRVIPTDVIRVPVNEPIEPMQDLVGRAMQNRPDLVQAHIQLDNAQISLKGSRNAVLPSLDLNVSAQGNSLVGQVNSLPPISGTGTTSATGGVDTLVRTPDPNLIGGFGGGLSQIFTGRYPNYGVNLTLSVPIYNRIATADLVRDRLTVRQQEVRYQQLQKQVRVDVANALIAVQQTRAGYQAAVQAREFQEQSLEAERQKLAVGASTNYQVIQYQRDLAATRSAEVAALSDYVKARDALDRAVGGILENNNVSIEDVYRGQLSHDPKPVVTNPTP